MMKRIAGIVLSLFIIIGLPGCADQEPSVVKTYETTAENSFTESSEESSSAYITLVRYYEMSDGTWRTDDHTYQYRLEITGRMNNAIKDSTFVYLSNTEDITFEQAWKASGLSSNMKDYFKAEDARLVAMK